MLGSANLTKGRTDSVRFSLISYCFEKRAVLQQFLVYPNDFAIKALLCFLNQLADLSSYAKKTPKAGFTPKGPLFLLA